jgi:hypothetical protein
LAAARVYFALALFWRLLVTKLALKLAFEKCLSKIVLPMR